jgi:PAS domain S-box-containing protein
MSRVVRTDNVDAPYVDADARLAALRRYNVLDTPPEDDFDRIVDLAAHLFEAPIALITLVDADRQWHKATHGTEMQEIGRAHSFCRHALTTDTPTVIENLAADERTADNPYVTGPPHLRFYAGAPLTTDDGHRLGTVCVLDTEPRTPSADDLRQLEHLADLAMETLADRQYALGDRPELQQTVLDHLPGVFYIVNQDGRLTHWNARFENVSGHAPETLQGRPATRFFAGNDRARIADAIETVFAEGSVTVEADFVPKDGTPIPTLFTGVRTRLQGTPYLVGMGVDISERREQARKRRLLAEAVRQTSEAVFIADHEAADGAGVPIRYVNEAFESTTGYTQEEIEGRTIQVLQCPDANSGSLTAFREHLAAEEPFRQETINCRKDGTRYIAQWNVTPVRSDDGAIEYWVAAHRDVTEQRQRENQLKEKERRLRQVTEGIDEVFWLRTRDELLYVSPSFERLWGRSADRLHDDVDAYLDWVHPDDRTTVANQCEALVEHGGPLDTEYRIVRPDGEVRWVDVQFEAVADFVEERRYAGVFRDITEQKQAEQAVKEERDRLATLFRTLPTPVIHGVPKDDRFIVLTVNPAFERVFGVDVEAMRGRDLHEAIVPDGERAHAESINQRLLEGETVQAEVQRETESGEERVFHVQAAARSSDDGSAEAYAIYTDITERKHYEQRLREAKERAEEAAQLKSAMLANMSHEVRTPLTSITGFAEVLEDELDGQPAHFAAMIHQNSERLMQTLDAVLQLSELDAGVYTPDREALRLHACIRGVLEEWRAEADAQDVRLTTALNDGPLHVKGDHKAVERILANLIGNGIKFTGPGGRVTVRTRAEDDTVVIDVEDTGIGIRENQMPDVFEAFHQASAGTKRDYEGTGLGLTITKRLVEAHGGTVQLASEKGEGTRATVRLPRAERP